MRIVCDTNVLLRAAIARTELAGELLGRIRTSHELVLSLPILAELLEVLRRPKIQALHGLDEHGIRRFVTALYKVSEIVTLPQPIPRVALHDPDDDAVLFTALGGRADVLATRDRHLLHADVQAFALSHGLRIMGDDTLLAELRCEQP
jgi:putative PIN family toxin of toxin-antitoxin system